MRAAVVGLLDSEYDIARGRRAAAQLFDKIAAAPPDGAHAVHRKRKMATFRAKWADVAENCILHAEHRFWIPFAKRFKPRNPLCKFYCQVVRRHPGVYSVAMLLAARRDREPRAHFGKLLAKRIDHPVFHRKTSRRCVATKAIQEFARCRERIADVYAVWRARGPWPVSL